MCSKVFKTGLNEFERIVICQAIREKMKLMMDMTVEEEYTPHFS